MFFLIFEEYLMLFQKISSVDVLNNSVASYN